jgi:mycothiol S-conjugate amidase
MVATCTGGSAAPCSTRRWTGPEVWERLPQIRVEEMARAREILGVEQEFLGFVDSGLPEGDPLPPLPEGCFALVPTEEAAAPLVELIRRFRRTSIDPTTSAAATRTRPHQDPRVSVHAFEAAGDPDRYPELGEPWQPLKLYYQMGFTLPRTRALHEAILASGKESPYAEWLENWDPERDMSHRVTTRVPCAEYFAVRDAALIAHATQIDPNGRWFACPLEVQQRIWPTEDYELARSVVDSPVPEDDLFAGVRSEVVVR